MTDNITSPTAAFDSKDRGAATIGTVAGAGALFSAAACCVLPLGLAALGVGASGLSLFEPLHWPMTIAAAVAVTVGWLFYLSRRRRCAVDSGCAVSPPARSTLVMLLLATLFVALSALWPALIEKPLMNALGGA